MNKSNVIVRMDYKLSLNNIDRNKNNFIKESNYVNRMIDYFIDDKKRIINMLDYFTGKINKEKEVNLVLENGKYASKEEIDKRKKYINKQFQNSNIWQIIISPDKKLVEENINWREFYKALKETGFDGVFSLEVALTSRISDSAADVMLSTLPVLISEIMREDY